MIQPQYQNFSKMISERLFRIPLYQRHYSWQRHQRVDLFDDVATIAKYEDREHFMATVVCLDTGERVKVGSESLSLMEVVDGQQRLTTLVMLLKAIEKELSSGTDNDQEEARLLKRILCPAAGQYLILQTNHDNSHIFQNYLRSGTIPELSEIHLEADMNIRDGILDCESLASRWKDGHSLVGLLSLIKNRLHFIFQLFEDEQAVYTIFEVLNSRGLPVDSIDKCKSMLMGALFESSNGLSDATIQIENNHKLWAEIYREIGLRTVPGAEILSFAATLDTNEATSKPFSEEDSLSYFRKLCTSEDKQHNISTVSSISKWLLKVTRLLVRLHADSSLRAITQIRHARLLAIAIMSADNIADPLRKLWLRQWEIVTFRIHSIFDRDSRYSVGDYVRLAQSIVKQRISKEDVLQELIKLGNDYPIDEAVKLMQKEDCYNGWEEEVRYLFHKYEEHLAKKHSGNINQAAWAEIWSNTAVRSIEHVYPQGEDTFKLSQWKGKIKGGQRSVMRHIHRIGNLVLLTPSLNSQAGQIGFPDKKKIYMNSNLFQAKEVCRKVGWTLLEIEQRERTICDWLKREFSDVEAP
jgi:hypothetical protein